MIYSGGTIQLYSGKLKKVTLSFVVIALFCCFSTVINAENEMTGACSFLGVKKTSRVGKIKPEPDGAPNAVFSILFTTPIANKKIDEIEIKASNPSKLWTSRLEGHGADFLGVALAKNPSDILNRKEGELKLRPLTDQNLLLFVADDGLFSKQGRKYQIRVLFTDGSVFNCQAQEDLEINQSLGTSASAVYPVRMSAFSRGISNYDAVGLGKKLEPANKPNALFELKMETNDREITAIEIRNIGGEKAVWDTIPTSQNPPIGVALKSDPTRLINEPDGSLKLRVKNKVDLNLYVADNGIVEKDKSAFRINVAFSDGQIYWAKAEKSPFSSKENSEEAVANENGGTEVNFLGEWLGFVSTDAVGPYPEIKPDGKPDSVFGLDIEVHPKSTITGIEINSVTGVVRKWGTFGTTPGAWGIAVAYQRAPTALLNKPDGSISIPIEGRTQFYLYAYDPGDLAQTNQNLRIIVRLADGSYYQQMVKKGIATTSTVAPEIEAHSKAKGLITCEFRGFLADLVNTSTRPGPDGYLDGTFIMKLQVDNKKLQRVDLLGPDGVVRWSSEPKAPQMFLGVALYPKIYQLTNAKGGPLNIPVSGRRTIYLYAADNGLLSDPKSRLTVNAVFSDKASLSTEVVK
ncbi:MAG: hypothetical protein ACP5VS_01170 [Desulfomonilaceae bacterium]